MMNKKMQMDIEDMFKAVVTLIFGITFLTVLAPLVAMSDEIVSSFVTLGVLLIIVSVIIVIISLLPKDLNFY